MALSRVKTWAAAEVLTASDLNAEFNNILSNALTLISPLTGNLDLDGNEFILDGDADTSISADTDDRIDFKLGGSDIFRLNTVATAVNGIDFYGSATGNQPYIQAIGTDTNFGLDIRDSNGNEIIITDGVASAVNEISITNAVTTANPIIASSGDDTNIGIDIIPKGTGELDLTSGAFNENKGADIASATTTDIGAATGNFVDITGTTTIAGFGTVKAGTRRILHFDGALTITYNATSMITLTGADYKTVAGEVLEWVSLGSGNWMQTGASPVSGEWTPVLWDDSLSSAEGQTYTTQYGSYTKILNRILFHGTLEMLSLGTLTTNQQARIGDLPLTSSSTANSHGGISVFNSANHSGVGNPLMVGEIAPNTNYISLLEIGATNTVQADIGVEVLANTKTAFFGQYII